MTHTTAINTRKQSTSHINHVVSRSMRRRYSSLTRSHGMRSPSCAAACDRSCPRSQAYARHMEIFWMLVLVAIGGAWTLWGWMRLRYRDGRVPRKPRYVELPNEEGSD